MKWPKEILNDSDEHNTRQAWRPHGQGTHRANFLRGSESDMENTAQSRTSQTFICPNIPGLLLRCECWLYKSAWDLTIYFTNKLLHGAG